MSLRRLTKRDPAALFALGSLACRLTGTLIGPPCAHYFSQTAPAPAMAAGYGFLRMSGAVQPRQLRLVARIALAGAILPFPLAVHSG